jgi:hypothetical protein
MTFELRPLVAIDALKRMLAYHVTAGKQLWRILTVNYLLGYRTHKHVVELELVS